MKRIILFLSRYISVYVILNFFLKIPISSMEMMAIFTIVDLSDYAVVFLSAGIGRILLIRSIKRHSIVPDRMKK